MDNSNYIKNLCNSLSHSGIKGQKWGLRRFQNEDGTLTDLGKKRYLDDAGNLNAKGKEVLSNEKNLLQKTQKKFVDSKGNITELGKHAYGYQNKNDLKYDDDMYNQDLSKYGKVGANRIKRGVSNGIDISTLRKNEDSVSKELSKKSSKVGKAAAIVAGILTMWGVHTLGKKIEGSPKFPKTTTTYGPEKNIFGKLKPTTKIGGTGNKFANTILSGTVMLGSGLIAGSLAKLGATKLSNFYERNVNSNNGHEVKAKDYKNLQPK